MPTSALLLLIACAMIRPLGSCWTEISDPIVHCVWSRKCHFGSTNSPVTLYTSLSTVLFVLKREFKESMDLNRESWTLKLGTGAGWERCIPLWGTHLYCYISNTAILRTSESSSTGTFCASVCTSVRNLRVMERVYLCLSLLVQGKWDMSFYWVQG